MIKETVVRFGAAPLVGIVTEPPGGITEELPCFIILNAGVLHRVGPARLHVALARAVAARGFCALRFDFSGIGDSEPRRDDAGFERSSLLEVRDAMDFMVRSRGVSSFVLFGLCSGADVAFLAAKSDPRVVGHVSLDGFAYRTPGYYLRYYGRRMLRPRSWLGLARRLAARLLRLDRAARNRAPRSLFARHFPPRDQTAAELRALAARGVQQFFVYSAGHERWYNHAGQFDAMFPDVDFRGAVCVRYFDCADHTFPDFREQTRLVSAIVEWAQAVWRVTPAAAPVAVGARAAEELVGR